MIILVFCLEVWGTDYDKIKDTSAAQDLTNKGANIVKGDLDDSDSLEHAVKDVDSIFLM